MLALKVPLKDAQKWKRYLSMNNLFNKEYFLLKDEKFIYYPLVGKFHIVSQKDSGLSFVDKDFKRIESKGGLRKSLLDKLSDEEMQIVQTAHDIVGTIAILEIPEGLEKREKLIAEILLKINPQLKTVLKKAASHEGTFRTQKMTYLAGIKTKETIYKENNVQIKLDVEKVYFSIRLSNERKRIAQLVEPGEEILVMFSGCAPYSLVLSRSTKAKNITSIEINPDGHKYALENLKLNKMNNIILVNGDVKTVMPNLFLYTVGLKSAAIPSEMAKPLEDIKHTAHIYEFHLFDNDLFERLPELEKAIKHLQSKGIRVMLHMPFCMHIKLKKGEKSSHKALHYSLARKDITKELEMLTILGNLCKKYDCKAIVHVNSDTDYDEEFMVENLKKIKKYYDWFYFETLTHGFSNSESVIRIGEAAGIKNVCIDLVHQYIMSEDNDKMVEDIKDIKKHFNTYFHIADHDKKIHTCELGKGFIDFRKMAPLINTGVLEIESKDYIEDKEMIRSHHTLNKYSNLRKFDRIIMPLPKTADEFLDEALLASKKGTVIHFYDFLEEAKFGEAIDKIDAVCKKNHLKYKIIETIRCGQHAPHVFRICVDFEIL